MYYLFSATWRPFKLYCFNKEMEVYHTNLLNNPWSISKLFKAARPGWSVHMQAVTHGDHSRNCSTRCLPMIELDPKSYTYVYSTLKFITVEVNRLNIEVSIVTFDQCLWIKATEVICAKSGQFQNIVIRLDGFHTLMSFLGSIGELMSASRLQEVMETIYAPNAVSHNMTVKSFDRAMRAYLLIAAALFAILVSDGLPCELPSDYIKVDLTELSEESLKTDPVNSDLQELITLQTCEFTGRKEKYYQIAKQNWKVVDYVYDYGRYC